MNVVMVIDHVNGQGHVSRSTALREAMPPGWRISVCDGAGEHAGNGDFFTIRAADIIVVDDYRVDAALIAHWQDRCPVVVFDDGQFAIPDEAMPLCATMAVRAHGGTGASMIYLDGRVYLRGHDYCPIRKLGEVPVVDGVVVSSSSKAKLLAMIVGTDIHVWPSRPRLLVCAGGQTSLEAAHLGVPSVIVTVADNQNANARGLQDAGLARWFGTWAEATANPGALAECVREQLANEAWRKHVAVEGPKWIDGKGGARIVEHMRRLVQR